MNDDFRLWLDMAKIAAASPCDHCRVYPASVRGGAPAARVEHLCSACLAEDKTIRYVKLPAHDDLVRLERAMRELSARLAVYT